MLPVDLDIPPQTVCVRCARTDCEGCAAPEPQRQALAWENSASVRSLWLTALQTVRDVEGWVGAIEHAHIGRALGFACLAESLAALSFCPLIAGSWVGLAKLGFVAAPSVTSLAVGSLLFALGFAALLVALHLLFGVSLELHAMVFGERRGAVSVDASRVQTSQGAHCLALYACGWDVLTSPLGVMLALFGLRDTRVDDVTQAAKVPRVALQRYFVGVRSVARSRATTVIVSSFALPLGCLLLAGLASGVVWLSLALG